MIIQNEMHFEFIHNTRLFYSVSVFILAMLIIGYTKPSFLFDTRDGSFREFGVGKEKTVYSMGVVVVTLSSVVFYIFSMVDMMMP